MIGAKVNTDVKGQAAPTGPKQSSGKTIHNRRGGVNLAGDGENMKYMPKQK